MKGNGNGITTLLRKLYFMLIPTSGGRSSYILKHKCLFRHVGDRLFFQPRKFPTDPELISFGDNVMVASDVAFINHDIVNSLISKKLNVNLDNLAGCIQIGNNVMIGAKSIIMPDVRIGDNVVIAAGSIVTKDIEANSVVAGIPAKMITTFDSLMDKRLNSKSFISDSSDKLWNDFNEKRQSRN